MLPAPDVPDSGVDSDPLVPGVVGALPLGALDPEVSGPLLPLVPGVVGVVPGEGVVLGDGVVLGEGVVVEGGVSVL